MSWGMAIWGWALLGVVALGLVVVWATQRHEHRVAAYFQGALLERVLPTLVRRRRHGAYLLSLVGLALLVVALAEPLYGKEVREFEAEGVDIVLIVDLSRSMDARDVQPSRLDRAKREIYDLIDLLEGDRVGLVIYAGGAYPRMPLSRDYDALSQLIGELDTLMFQAQGSALGEAIRMATKLLSGNDRPAGRAILVLSDGEVHDPADAMAAAGDAVAEGIVIYGMGVGIEAAPIPLREGGVLEFQHDVVLTTPDDKVLRELARESGGAYVQSVASVRDMREIYVDGMRATLTTTSRGSVREEVWKSGFQWPLGLGLFFWLLASWAGDGRRRFGGVGALLLALGLAAAPAARAGDLADADALYRAERYAEAVDAFSELALDRPNDPNLYDRLGAARFRAEDYVGAARAFDHAAELRGGDADTTYNAGNAHYLSGRLEEALARYERVLEQEPEHRGAGHNRDVLLAELEERQLALPPEQQPQGGEGEPGEPGEEQDGSSEEGEPGEPGSEGMQPPSESDEPGEADSEGQTGETPPEADGGQPAGRPEDAQVGEEGEDSESQRADGEGDQERDDDSESGTADMGQPGEGDPEDGEPVGEPFNGAPEADGPVTAAQAERLLEGVEEGRPRIRVPGNSGDKPW